MANNWALYAASTAASSATYTVPDRRRGGLVQHVAWQIFSSAASTGEFQLILDGVTVLEGGQGCANLTGIELPFRVTCEGKFSASAVGGGESAFQILGKAN